MNLDRLNKAATAAGYAMATPDDDPVDQAVAASKPAGADSRALVLADQTSQRTPSAETVSHVTNWLKSHIPSFGWRAPA
jgi:hypothetical protein